jgi:bisphosphoglycerate-independent phosphoglycerate mutase (AlkP superfamily)
VEDGARLLEVFDSVMAGMLEAWDDAEGVLIVTSDHGNMEDLSHGKHTENDVPTLVIGDARDVFRDVHDLSDLVPRMGRLLFAES